MSTSILIGHRITIEPIYEHAYRLADDNSIAIEPAMPKLAGMVSDREAGIKAVNEYFAAIPI